MAKTTKKESEKWVDPDYPFRTEWNENGEITYYVPVEADSYDALITLNAADRGGCKTLPIGPSRRFSVVFICTTNAAFAYDQCAWLSRKTWADVKWYRHNVSVENRMMQEVNAGMAPVPAYRPEHVADPFREVDESDLADRIAEFIDRKHPKNPGYRKICLWRQEGLSPAEIAEKMGISPKTVYDYLKVIRENVREYLRRCLLD